MAIGNRRSERVPTNLAVRWVRRDSTDELSAVDINMHGLFVLTAEQLAIGSLLQLKVELPEGAVTMFATVRFVGQTASGTGAGLEIFLMEQRERAQWRAHYTSLSRARQAVGAKASNG